MAIAYYLILEDNNPLYRFEKWNFTHKHPYGADITSPRNSEFFASITDEQVNKFFRLRGKRRVEEEYWAYDSNSISSYSETLAQVQYGKNKEDDKLPQLNLLLYLAKNPTSLFITASWQGISLIPRRLSIFFLENLDILGFGKTKFVMDGGFYSEENINGLYREHVKFLVGTRLSLKFIKKNLDDVYEDDHLNYNINMYEENQNVQDTMLIGKDKIELSGYIGENISQIDQNIKCTIENKVDAGKLKQNDNVCLLVIRTMALERLI